MMRHRKVLAWVLILAACSEPSGPRPAVPDADGRIAFTISDANIASDQFTLRSAEMVADTIVIEITYGGGCAEHAFVLQGSAAFAESMPVQTPVRLVHEAFDDACRALIGKTLRADVSALRDAYRRGYQTEHGTIAINLAGTQVSYTF